MINYAKFTRIDLSTDIDSDWVNN